MSATTAGTIAGKALDTLRDGARDGARWWMTELRATLPRSWLMRISGVARPCFTLTMSQDGGVVGRLNRPSGSASFTWAASEFRPDTVKHALAAHHLQRNDVSLVVACDSSQFFIREMLVPRAALSALPGILARDVLHRTPFELDQIWHGAVSGSSDTGGDVVAVTHWIIGRDRAAAQLARYGLQSEDIDGLTVADVDPAPTIAFHDDMPAVVPWANQAIRWLAIAAVATTMLAFAAVLLAEAVTAARIDSAIAELREGNPAGPDGNRAARLYASKASPGAVDVWAELSRLLPEDTFLSDLRMTDGAITLSGFSSNAAKLVRLVEQSPMFSAAHLTGAITPDATERKDHFSLAFQLRGSGPVRTAASPGAQGRL